MTEELKESIQNPPYTGNYADNLLRIALDIGGGLLKNGAEVRRVEFTVEKICKAYGAVHVEVFSIHSLILASVRLEDGSHSFQTRRILGISNNMVRIEQYNSLSRRICEEKPEFSLIDSEIKNIKSKNSYPTWLLLFGYILGAAGFAVFFGGTLRDALAAALIAPVVFILDSIHFDYFNSMVKTLFMAFFAGLLSCFAAKLGFADNMNMVIVGTMMLLIPGLSLGNAMRDLLCGDTLAGSLKTVQAILSATMIAIGYALAIMLTGGVL